MNYWQKRALASEAKANRIAVDALKASKKMYRGAYKRIVTALAELELDIGKGTATRSQLWQYKKYTELRGVIGEEIGELTKGQISMTEEALNKVYMTVLDTTLYDLGASPISYNLVSKSQIKTLISTAWNDEHFSSRLWGAGSKIGSRIEQDITNLVVLGESPSKIKKQIMDDLNVSYRTADRLVRTEANYFGNKAALDGYLSEGITRFEFMVGHDDRLCDRCSAKAGIYEEMELPKLPVHPNCRCCIAPIVDEGI